MKVFVEISHLAASLDRRAFADAIREIDDSGAHGVTVSDHLFHTFDNQARRERIGMACEPLTTLAVVAGLSERLELQTLVMNTAWIHPALVLRQFAQLAQLLDGERVTAGLGAGWSVEEFAALGLEMPRFALRMARLRETLAMARELFDDGLASYAGTQVQTVDLPLSPRPTVAPRLLVGGGSDAVLDMAGRYADVLDLHGHPERGKVVGATMTRARHGDRLRRALTTVADLEERLTIVDDATITAGRTPIEISGSIFFTVYGSRSHQLAVEEQLCQDWTRIAPQSLRQSPYLLFGEPREMADTLRERAERYRLGRVTLLSETDVPSVPPDPLRFCREVLPLLG